jgi:hypothetical protein
MVCFSNSFEAVRIDEKYCKTICSKKLQIHFVNADDEKVLHTYSLDYSSSLNLIRSAAGRGVPLHGQQEQSGGHRGLHDLHHQGQTHVVRRVQETAEPAARLGSGGQTGARQ